MRLPFDRAAMLSVFATGALCVGTTVALRAAESRAVGAAGAPAAAPAAGPELPPGDRPPPNAVSRLEDAGTAADYDGADYVIAYQSSRTRVRERGVAWVDGYTLYKALTEAGANELGVLRWDYEPLSSRVQVRSVTLYREGRSVPVSLAGLQDRPAPQSAIYWGPRIVTLQLPRLRVGDGIEVSFCRQGFTYALLGDAREAGGIVAGSGRPPGDTDTVAGSASDSLFVPPMEGEYFDIVRFQSTVPIREMEYVLALSREKRLQSEVYNGPLFTATRYTPDSTWYTWRGRDLPALPDEPRQPDDTDFAVKVVLTTVDSWEAKSRWFFDVNRDQFGVTDAVREKVEEILEERGLAGADEARKAKALLHWVAQNIRYSGQTMGAGEGYTLHPGTMILEQRSGVCKDIAGMLITMMRAAGMETYGAMTMAGSRIDAVPADQFNHCVVALRRKDGCFTMYDPTWAPFSHNIWSRYETEQHFLIGTPEGESLNRVPYSPPSDSPMDFRHEAALAADGTLEGTITMKGRGAVDSRLRSFVSYERRRDFERACAEMLAQVSDRVEILSCEHGEILDFDTDMWIRVGYRIPQYALPVGDGLEFRSPMMALVTHHWVPFRAAAIEWKAEERKSDILLYFTQRFDGAEVVRLPAGQALARLPESKSVDETYASFAGRAAAGKGTVTVSAEGELRRRQVPPDGYPGFKRAMDRAREWAEVVYRVEKGGAR